MVVGVTPSGEGHIEWELRPIVSCQHSHFGSMPPSCMHILRPVIGLVEGVWWGGDHSNGDISVSTTRGPGAYQVPR